MFRKIECLLRRKGAMQAEKIRHDLAKLENISMNESSPRDKRYKTDQLFRDADFLYRTKLKNDSIQDLSNARLRCVEVEKKKNNIKNPSLFTPSGETSDDPKYICQTINKYCFNFIAVLTFEELCMYTNIKCKGQRWFFWGDLTLISSIAIILYLTFQSILQVDGAGGDCISDSVIECFECNSWEDERCNDPFNYTLHKENMPPLLPCEGCCVKMVQFIGTEHYQIKRTCTDHFEVNFFMVNHACMTEGHRHGRMCFFVKKMNVIMGLGIEFQLTMVLLEQYILNNSKEGGKFLNLNGPKEKDYEK
ncbi:unnamed protein product [Lepeophtheirus salmonis]|uniref:(salmon louse) hypothetical protein n=1 Tax=Lepeophtheirus salmonis TaxID=72036 RepID=A0A7R8CZ69_LEPSM|nr:unnamed protein product [Lepeophtheirus salmonis]CAF2973317.1 unnamed protein product [Lepeophtheirus salmonis]